MTKAKRGQALGACPGFGALTMNQHPASSPIQTFRVGPKNKRLDDPGQPSGYQLAVDSGPPLPELLERHTVVVVAGEDRITSVNFPYANEPAVVQHVELFDFSARSDYGRDGVDEAFVRDKLAYFEFRPATLPEMVCFASHFRESHRDQWFEAKHILALGSVLTANETVKKGGWFRKEVMATYRYYPGLECVSGRPHDILSLSQTERDSDGNWPSSTLFLAVTLQ